MCVYREKWSRAQPARERVGSGDETLVQNARGDRASSDLVSADVVSLPLAWLGCCVARCRRFTGPKMNGKPAYKVGQLRKFVVQLCTKVICIISVCVGTIDC